MAYYLTGFGDVQFPIVQPTTAMPTAKGMTGSVATLGGGLDAWGSDTAPAEYPQALQYRVIVTDQDAAAYVTAVNALRALGRKRDYLYRTGQDGNVQRALARLLNVDAMDTIATFSAIELSFDFELWSEWLDNWERAVLYFDETPVWLFDTGLHFDAAPLTTTLTASPQIVSVTNGGNVPVDDCVLTVTAGDAAITSLTIAIAAMGVKWTWIGTLSATKSLVVDAGALSVLDDGADAYAYFALDATHSIVPWLRLAPGANSVVVTRTGGGTGSIIDFDFADRWA